jgi:hypothetical protein
VYVPSIDVGDTLSIGGAKILSVTDITDALTTDSLTAINYMNVQPAIKTMDSSTVTDSKTVLVPGGTFTFTASLSGFATLFIDSSGVRLKKMEVSWNSDGVTTIDASYGQGYIATSTSNTASTISFYDGGTSAILKNNLAYTVTAKIKGIQ